MQHTETTHPYNFNLKLAFPKVASCNPHHLTFTLQFYHHAENRFTSWSMQMTSPSHLHTQAREQQRNTYNYTSILDKQNNLTLNPDKTTCTLFTPDSKLTYNTDIHNRLVHAHKPLQIIKALTEQHVVNRRHS